ncbi:hypothetical protein JMJ77_0004336 [Colletotrichum scovillei]|uniref:Uncharacterized protein n=1 Tax=Colletotrichum scovillei TaxID=1209932 RepID=A0A9P7UE92_9PEZI|nr:hypothetical protein JMJ77_0004336 [Colletotrichum scovillei]KAG7049588.1 hypothetical protein JMJ78_0013569 [Colletotrichum scovillei]KAG7064330.1 hypothetical protein JMJ76_0007375 [Colletotrichum scovillei]
MKMEERRAQDAESDGEGGKKRWEEEEKMGRGGRGGKFVRVQVAGAVLAALLLWCWARRCAAKKESVPVASLLVARRLGGGSGGFARYSKRKSRRLVVGSREGTYNDADNKQTPPQSADNRQQSPRRIQRGRAEREQRAQVEVAVPLPSLLAPDDAAVSTDGTGLLDFWILDSGLTHAGLKWPSRIDTISKYHSCGWILGFCRVSFGRTNWVRPVSGPPTPSTISSYFLSLGLGERGTKNRQWASTIDHQPPTHRDCTLLLLSASRSDPTGCVQLDLAGGGVRGG